MLAGAPELHQMTWFGFGKVSLQFLQAQILIPSLFRTRTRAGAVAGVSYDFGVERWAPL